MWSYSRFYALTSFSTKPFVILLKLSTRWINWGLHNVVDDGNVLLKVGRCFNSVRFNWGEYLISSHQLIILRLILTPKRIVWRYRSREVLMIIYLPLVSCLVWSRRCLRQLGSISQILTLTLLKIYLSFLQCRDAAIWIYINHKYKISTF